MGVGGLPLEVNPEARKRLPRVLPRLRKSPPPVGLRPCVAEGRRICFGIHGSASSLNFQENFYLAIAHLQFHRET